MVVLSLGSAWVTDLLGLSFNPQFFQFVILSEISLVFEFCNLLRLLATILNFASFQWFLFSSLLFIYLFDISIIVYNFCTCREQKHPTVDNVSCAPPCIVPRFLELIDLSCLFRFINLRQILHEMKMGLKLEKENIGLCTNFVSISTKINLCNNYQ